MLAQILSGGVTIGMIYGLIALGFVLLYNGTGVIHFGYGEQVTLGAYYVVMIQVFLGGALAIAVPLAIVLSAITGAAIYFLVMRPLSKATLLIQLIATLAIGMALRELMRAFMGPSAWPAPFLMSPVPFEFAGLRLVPANLAIVGVVLATFLALYLFLEHSRLGKAVLAACENQIGASLMGIRTSHVFLGIWMLSSAVAGLVGILIAPILTLSPELGLIAIKGFVAAVLGGFTLGGAVVGGIILGIIETLSGAYISTALKDLVTFAVLIIVLLVRPQGLAGIAHFKKV